MPDSPIFRRIGGSTAGPALLGGLALVGLAGYVAAWMPHVSPALRVAGLDLGEVVKFLPQVRSGEIRLVRELFYLPPLACALALLLAGWWWSGRGRWLARLAAVGGAVLAALLMLPPVWTPTTLLRGEFRWQGLAMVVCAALALASPALHRPRVRRGFAGLVAIVCLLAATVPAAQYWRIRPALEQVYRAVALPVGWGVWCTAAAFLAAAVVALAACGRAQADSSPRGSSGFPLSNDGNLIDRQQ
ncbi:MAG: hypothetical protein GX605_04675 [Chloroflexi bacterium]|nr:hypothetical protein [Chloroflexota bacterium]